MSKIPFLGEQPYLKRFADKRFFRQCRKFCLFEFALCFPNSCGLGLEKNNVRRPFVTHWFISRIPKKGSE